MIMFISVNNGKLPTRGSKHSACVDLYAREDLNISAGQTVLIPLGVAIDENQLIKIIDNYDNSNIPMSEKIENFKCSHYLQLMLRSSLSKKLIIANGVGVIDLDYKDEIMIRVHNPMDEFIVHKGDRIAQITILEHKAYMFGIETDIERNGGFGSTGKN